MVTRRAECSCSQLSAICSGEPIRISMCHCLACKQRTGSAFSFNARFAKENVSIQGRAVEFTRIGDEGCRVTYSFCPDCGTTVHYRIDAQPGLVAIPVGAFADLPSRRPSCPSIMADRIASSSTAARSTARRSFPVMLKTGCGIDRGGGLSRSASGRANISRMYLTRAVLHRCPGSVLLGVLSRRAAETASCVARSRLAGRPSRGMRGMALTERARRYRSPAAGTDRRS